MIPLLETVYYRQLSILGSRGLSAHRFSALFELIASGRLNMQQLFGRRITLEQVSDVFYQMDNHEDVGITLIDSI